MGKIVQKDLVAYFELGKFLKNKSKLEKEIFFNGHPLLKVSSIKKFHCTNNKQPACGRKFKSNNEESITDSLRWETQRILTTRLRVDQFAVQTHYSSCSSSLFTFLPAVSISCRYQLTLSAVTISCHYQLSLPAVTIR